MRNGSVLITGGAGFIGCALARQLVAQGHEVVAMDALVPAVHARRARPPGLPDAVRLFIADVTDAGCWRRILELAQPETIVHLAAETSTSGSLRNASRHAQANVVGTTRMTDALTASGDLPRQIVLASSRAVYGEGTWCDADERTFNPGPRRHLELVRGIWDHVGPTGLAAVPLPHRAAVTIPNPASVYAATKLAQEHVLGAWAAATGVGLSVLRLQNVFGPGQSLTNGATGVLAHFVALATRHEVIEVFEDGQIIRDFVYVEDAASALAAAIHRPTDVRVLDVGSGEARSLLSVARSLAATGGAPEPRVTGTFHDGDVRAASCDPTDAARDLHYRPEWSFERGLDALYEWAVREATAGRAAETGAQL